MNKNYKRPLIIDGAMGTELMNLGVDLPLPLWSSVANFDEYDKVVDIHKRYINAGSDIITSNTFRTTARTFKKAGYTDGKANEISKRCTSEAIKAAKEAINNKNVLLAGSIAPLEDCYEPDRFPGKIKARKEFEEIIQNIDSCGVDIFLFETMGNFEEIETILELSRGLNQKRWLSIVLKNETSILDGTSLEKTIRLLKKYRLDMLLINCTPIDVITNSLGLFTSLWDGKWGTFPNAGKSMPSKEGEFESKVEDDFLSNTLKRYMNLGAVVLGACCGSTPNTIRKFRDIIED